LIDAFVHTGPSQLDEIQGAIRDGTPLAALATLGLFRTSARLLGAVALEDGAGRYRRRSNPTTPRLR